MSVFRSLQIACPKCGSTTAHNTVFSVNAVRRPDLRIAIADGSFQRAECPSCGTAFRLDPEFAFVDAGARQWIAAYPLARQPDWRDLEAQAQQLFDRVYGEEASEFLQGQGRTFVRRVTFGWAGLREKIVIVDRGLDDLAIELCKAAVLRSSAEVMLDGRVDLRLVDVDDAGLRFAWLLADNEQAIRTLTVVREMYDEIAGDADGAWDELRTDLQAGLYLDLNRLILAGPSTPSTPTRKKR